MENNNQLNSPNFSHKRQGEDNKIEPDFNFKNISIEDLKNEANKPLENRITAINELSQLANSCLIHLAERLEPPIAMQIVSESKAITLFTKGNFSIVTGAAKSRKSFLISMLMATAIKGNFHDIFKCNEQGVNILFDTEQAKYKVQQISKRICHLAETNNPASFKVFAFRTLEPGKRIALIEHVLSTTENINFVAIDGIIDLDIDPILQAEQAQNIVQKLMQWTDLYKIHITCVLHYNKTASTLLGHLGSFSHRKADAVIEVTKNKEDNNISIVSPVDCREKEFQPFAFSVDEFGMPYILENYVIEPKAKTAKETKPKKPPFTPNALNERQHSEILLHVFKATKQYTYNDCWRGLKNATETIAGLSIGDNKAKDLLTFYLANNQIVKVENKKTVYVLAGQSELHLSV